MIDTFGFYSKYEHRPKKKLTKEEARKRIARYNGIPASELMEKLRKNEVKIIIRKSNQ